MAIIEPSLDFEGSHLCNRTDPEPGEYTAKLLSFQVNPNTQRSYQLEWVLTNHPANNVTWTVRQWLPRKNPGLLSQMIWSWKRKKWMALGSDEIGRFKTMQTFIGDEANVHVDVLNSEHSGIMTVTSVWGLNMRGPTHYYSEEEAD